MQFLVHKRSLSGPMCLGNFHAFLSSVDFLKTSSFFKKKKKNLSKIKSNSLDDDQAR